MIVSEEIGHLLIGVKFFLTWSYFFNVFIFCMSPFVDPHGNIYSSTADENVEDDPDDHLGDLGLREELQAELENEDKFAEADHDEDPALGPDTLALWVGDIGVVLTSGWAGDQTEQQDPEHTDRVLRGHGEDVLDEEGVELHHLPDQHELDDGDESHVAGVGVEPAHGTPALGSELEQSSLELPLGAADVLDALPLVLSHLQELADLHPGEDAQAVTDEDVQHQVVPPALVEVGQEVAEDHLGELPHDRDAPE